MTNHSSDEVAENLEGALAAVIAVSRDPEMLSEYRLVSQAFKEEDYRSLVALAWRHQFDDNRAKFRREIRAFQENIAGNLRAIIDAGSR